MVYSVAMLRRLAQCKDDFTSVGWNEGAKRRKGMEFKSLEKINVENNQNHSLVSFS